LYLENGALYPNLWIQNLLKGGSYVLIKRSTENNFEKKFNKISSEKLIPRGWKLISTSDV